MEHIMKEQNILLINSSGRFNGSVTRQLSQHVVKQLQTENGNSKLVRRELTGGLPFTNEEWIEAIFTPVEHRNGAHNE